jgi:hypothetical protein
MATIPIGDILQGLSDFTFPIIAAGAAWATHWVGRKLVPHSVWFLVQKRVDYLVFHAVNYALNTVKGASRDATIEAPEVVARVVSVALDYARRHGSKLTMIVGLDTMREKVIARLRLAATYEALPEPRPDTPYSTKAPATKPKSEGVPNA